MFITQKRLEDIKANERWKHENRLNREREMSDMWERVRKLEYKVAMLEKKVNPATAEHTDDDEIYPIEYTHSPF